VLLKEIEEILGSSRIFQAFSSFLKNNVKDMKLLQNIAFLINKALSSTHSSSIQT